jgi:hypothetical protein
VPDGARIEELAREAGCPQLRRALPYPSRHGKGEAHLGPLPDGARDPTVQRVGEERLGTFRVELEAGG